MAKWIELVINSEKKITLNKNNPDAKINDLVSLGLMIRYKILLDHPELEPIQVFAIPGYGRTVNPRILAFNLFLKVNF